MSGASKEPAFVAVVVLATTLGCDFIGEKVAERAIEHSLEEQHGGNVDVDLERGGGKLSVKGTEGTSSIEVGKGAQVPDDFPSEVPVYPGAEVVAAISGAKQKGKGHMLTLRTNHTPEQVVAYYRKQLEGFEEKAQMSTGEMSMVVLRNPTTKRNVSVTASGKGDGSTVQLMVGDR